MDVIIRWDNNPVNDMTALISGLINDLTRLQRLRDNPRKLSMLSRKSGHCSVNKESVRLFSKQGASKIVQ